MPLKVRAPACVTVLDLPPRVLREGGRVGAPCPDTGPDRSGVSRRRFGLPTYESFHRVRALRSGYNTAAVANERAGEVGHAAAPLDLLHEEGDVDAAICRAAAAERSHRRCRGAGRGRQQAGAGWCVRTRLCGEVEGVGLELGVGAEEGEEEVIRVFRRGDIGIDAVGRAHLWCRG